MRRRTVALPLLVAGALAACSGDGDGGGGGEGATAASFCAAYEAIDDSDFATSDSEDPAEVDRILSEARELFDALPARAPEEIRPEAQELRDAYAAFADFVRSISFDVNRLGEAPPEVADAITTISDATSPSSPIGTFVEENCAIDLEEPTSQFSSISDEL